MVKIYTQFSPDARFCYECSIQKAKILKPAGKKEKQKNKTKKTSRYGTNTVSHMCAKIEERG